MTSHIRTSIDNGILELVIDRQDKKNSLTSAMYSALAAALEAAENDAKVRVILLRGEGEIFSAGNDIGEFASFDAGATQPRPAMRFLKAISQCSKPLVAAVQGRAVGVGMTMLLHCDYLVLADDAQLVTPFVNLALVPEAASSLLLPARIGYFRSFAMFALGESVSAQDAVAWGLANRLVSTPDLLQTARDVAVLLAHKPLGALIATKRLMRDTDEIAARMDTEYVCFTERLVTPEAKEAFSAFSERRAPDFSRFS